MTAAAQNDSGVHELIRGRWSPRAFSDRDIAPGDLKTLLEAARLAASCFNEQPWRFIVAPKWDPESYRKAFDTLVPKNQEWARSAPVLMITAGKRTFTHNGTPNHYGFHDAGAALATLMIQATAMGISVHAMGGLDRDKARATFGIPEDYEVGAAVAIGYLPDASKEQPPRVRKPLDEIAFQGEWGKPVSAFTPGA